MKKGIDVREVKITGRDGGLDKWLQDVAKYKPLTTQEEEELFCRYKETHDPKIREEILKRNQRFLLSCAKTYTNDSNTIMELISEGNIGLMNAIDRYDMTVGTKFMSYGVWWIKRSMSEYIASTHSMVKKRLPSQIRSYVTKIKREFFTENPDVREMPLDIISEKVSERFGKTFKNPLYFTNFGVVSSDSLKANEDPMFSYIEMLSASHNDCEEHLDQMDREDKLRKLIDKVCCNQLEKDLFCAFYGVLGHGNTTVLEVAQKYGLDQRQGQYVADKVFKRMQKYATTGHIRKVNRGRFQGEVTPVVKKKTL